MAKSTQVRTFARTAAKSMEKKLIDNAKELMKNPYLVLPEYSDKYSRKYFDKIKKSLDKVSKFKDDPKKLEKLSNKRGLDGAFAGTLLIAHSEKAPYLGVLEFLTGDVTYAQRGKADKEKLIAVQHFDDPVFRLLGIKDALKKKLHVYSWENGYISTGREAKPPEDFKDFLIKELNLTYKNKAATCGHIDPETAKKKETSKKNYLSIYWKSADITIAICEECAKLKKNTVINMTKYFLEPEISNDLIIDVVGQFAHQMDTKTAKTQNLNEYLSGELKDLEFIQKNLKHQKESVKASTEKILVLDGVSYGQDIDSFIDALKPNNFEKEALEIILKKVNEPIFFNNTTPNKVLEQFWKDSGLDVIKSVLDDEEMAKKFFSLEDSPSNILELVFNYRDRQQILSKLPKYKGLSPLAEFINDVVRTYKTFGEQEALSEIKKRPDNPKGKSIAYAFLLVFGKAEDRKWQFSQIEIEYGDFLKEYANKILKSEPENYHKAFQELLTASGSSENIDKNKL